MESLKLHWLGHPLVELKGRSVKLETRKAAALLAYLSLNPGECQREVLATMFWQEGNQQKALANLRRTLSSLNASLPGWIEADRESIALKRNGKLWVDVEAFHQSLSQLNEHNHPEDQVCEECLPTLDKAAELYRGDFLEGLNLGDSPGFDDWQFFQRDGLRQEVADVLQRLSAGHSERGQWDQVIACARRWIALDRLHEPACRVLMDVYARSGQRTAALHQYEELARLLKEQMGQEPEVETRRLYEQIRGRDEAKRVVEVPESPTSFPLLKTKLYIPAAPASRVVRAHLVERMGEVEKKALTIISAPAGFGKTTLLAEWIAQTALPVAWLSLDNGDNDPYRFLSYLIATLESIQEGLGIEARQIMQAPQLGPQHIILASLMNDLGKVAEPYVLVLDDYQFITEHAVHETIAYLLDHTPVNMHLVISTRADPPLQLGRLRAYDQMLELRTQDLRFTSEESMAFLNEIMRLDLSVEDIETLETRTEGWVVGLKMAALSLKGHSNRAQFMNTFSGTHRYILDYLLEEVLNAQPEEVNSFLLCTSILGQLNGALCNVITDRTDSYQILGKLEKENLFLTPMDDERQWYRYHHLFADIIRNRLYQSISEDQIIKLHTLASSWFLDNGYLDDAVKHACAAKDYDRVIHIIENNGVNLIASGEMKTLSDWIAKIPESIQNKSITVLRLKFWILAFSGRIENGEPLFKNIDRLLASLEQPTSFSAQSIKGELLIFRGIQAHYRFKFDQGIEYCEHALELIPEVPQTNITRGLAFYVLGDLFRVKGEFGKAEEKFLATDKIPLDFKSRIQTKWCLAVIANIRGQLRATANLYEEAYAIANTYGLKSGTISMADIGMSELLYERNEIQTAYDLLSTSIGNAAWTKTLNWWENPSVMVPGYAMLARILHALGQRETALEVVNLGCKLCEDYDVFPDFVSMMQAEKIYLWLAQGYFDQAFRWMQENPYNLDDTFDYLHEPERIVFARGLIEQAKLRVVSFETVVDFLESLADAAEAEQRFGRLIKILNLQALALCSLGDVDGSHKILRKSLTLAQPEGYMRIFLDEDKPMNQLLKEIKGSELGNNLRDYVNRLLEASTPPER